MDLQQDYLISLWGIACVIGLVLVQWFVATIAKGSRKDAVPGKIDSSLSHDSFVFRAHRTFMNTQENIAAMLGSAFLAIVVGANPLWCGILIWTMVLSRLVHMLLYYVIATEKNPSPRSYFFGIGLFANLGLFGLCIAALI